MRLIDLDFTHFLRGPVTEDDDAYKEFLKSVNYVLDLDKPEHRKSLLKWLNKWGCRQFAIKGHAKALKELQNWWVKNRKKLIGRKRNIWELTEAEISTLGEVYEQLMRCEASKRGKKKKPVSFGPTGAAKILFALRPKAVLLWDTAIRKEKGYDGSRESYESFLKYLQTELKALELECKKYGFSLSELPKKLQTKGDDILTVPKLLDEYYWLTITQGYSIPTLQILKGWLKLF